VAAAGGSAAGSAEAIVVPATKLDRYLGRYEVAPGIVAVVRREGDGIALDAFGRSFALTARSDSAFSGPGLPADVEFRTGPKGVGLFIKPLTIAGPVYPLAAAPTLSPAAQAAYVGRYTTSELDSWATVALRDRVLVVQSRQGPWSPMDAIAPDVFLANGARVAFTRGPRGVVTGFKLSAARLANIEYLKAKPPAER
jgi:hypothetical protein